MEKSKDKRIWAGLFTAAGVILIVTIVFVIGLDRGLTQAKFEAIVLFNEVGGLVEGAPIRISGVNVGIVKSVDFLNDPIEGRSLKVVINIYKKYEFQFRKCSRISIKTEGVLGQKLIEISEDKTRKTFDPAVPLLGADPIDVEDMAGVINRTAISLHKASEQANDVIDEWRYISHKTKRMIGRLEEKLIEGNLFKIF